MGYYENQRAGALDSFNKYFNDDEKKKYKKYFDEDMKYHADHKGQKGTWGNIDEFDNRAYYSDYNKSKMDNIRKDYEKRYANDPTINRPSAAESTIQAQSTQQANLRAQQTGVPDANNQMSESQKDTETKRRQNKAKGKRGFVVARESGQGINI